MAENGASSSSSSSSSLTKEKPVIVRVKRKLNQTRFDGFWLQIHERPSKRTLLDFSKLSISDSATEKVQEEQKSKKLFVQLVDTVTQSGAIDSVLQSYLTDLSDSKETKIDARRKTFKQGKKPDELRQVARQKHDELAKNARFEQIWKSRKGNKDSHESLREICHLYDVVQVDDSNEEKLPEMEKTRLSRIENDAIMCNYLPLLREFIPSAAKEIESDFLSTEDNYVYDLYTVENDAATKMADVADSYPLVQVDENNGDDDFYDGPDKSDYDTDDSNAEDNPLYDYPDEESEEEEEKDEFDVFEEEEEEYEREIVDFDDDNDNDNDDDEREVEYWRLGHC
ncbi:hypothetical protein LUZ60_015398 [Juncus effusus]|nr:hypothetical protein LUZ60_015398 [Juncus effusus]